MFKLRQAILLELYRILDLGATEGAVKASKPIVKWLNLPSLPPNMARVALLNPTSGHWSYMYKYT